MVGIDSQSSTDITRLVVVFIVGQHGRAWDC
jgi:hypothetical protein